jgi:hypothetical protein
LLDQMSYSVIVDRAGGAAQWLSSVWHPQGPGFHTQHQVIAKNFKHITDIFPLQKRSPSPAWRLEVCGVFQTCRVPASLEVLGRRPPLAAGLSGPCAGAQHGLSIIQVCPIALQDAMGGWAEEEGGASGATKWSRRGPSYGAISGLGVGKMWLQGWPMDQQLSITEPGWSCRPHTHPVLLK